MRTRPSRVLRLERPAALEGLAERDLVGAAPRFAVVARDDAVDDVLRHPAVRRELATGDRDEAAGGFNNTVLT